jgi:hypothetical protein
MKIKKWYLFLIINLFVASALIGAPGVIKSGDIIGVWVKGESELSVERQVGTDGSIAYPLIGKIGVNNLNTKDAAKLISQMLEDGYLRDPLVQVTVKKGRRSPAKSVTKAAPPGVPSAMTQNIEESSPSLIEVIDSQTRKGVGGVAMMLGNRIYQSNRLGQILVDNHQGRIIVLADGYQTLTGDFEKQLKPGSPPRIYIEPISFPDEIEFNVLDAFSRRPLDNVEIVLDNMKVNTNKQGVFKIKKLQKEFGEIALSKRGYKTHRMVIDFKGPQKQIILMVRND